MHTRVRRTGARRLAAAALLLLHMPLGAAAAVADARPLAGHPVPVFAVQSQASTGTSGADERVIAPDFCPFCGYLATQPVAADAPVALAVGPAPVHGTGPVTPAVEPVHGTTPLRPASRAPPLL